MKRSLAFITLFLTIPCLNAQSLQALGNGIMATNVNDLIVYKNQLYAGGYFTNSSGQGTEHIRRFVNGQWISPQGGVGGGAFPFVSDMAVIDDKLYVVGGFDIAGGLGVEDFAIWDSLQWSGNGMNCPQASTVFDYLGTLYCGKSLIASSAGSMPCLSQWDGTAWQDVGNFEFDAAAFAVQGIDAALVFQKDLILAGQFKKAGGIVVNNIVQFDGSNWSAMGNGLPGKVRALEVYNNELYAAGDFNNITFNYLVKWNGSGWVPVNNNFDYPVMGLKSFQNKLYIGGAFTLPKQGLAWYDGASIQAEYEFDAAVNTFTEYDGKLVIAGNFTSVDNQPYEHIVALDNELGAKENQQQDFGVFPNPAHDQVTVQFLPGEGFSVELRDVKGRLILRRDNPDSRFVFDVSHLAPGLYFLSVSNHDASYWSYEKLLVE